uniref:CSON003985 protein n=1 Tax=Culicoides sonorensis TaxID=179676 RepID=A0A336N0N9_CULSO
MEPPSTSASLTTQTQMTSGAGGIAPTQIVGGNTSQTGTTNPTTQGVSSLLSPTETVLSPGTNTGSLATSREEEEDSTNHSSDCKSPGGTRTKSNQRWMKLRTTVQISSAIQSKKPPLKREDSFLKRFSTRQIPETQETIEDTGSEGAINDHEKNSRRRRRLKAPKTVVNPDENFYFYWLMLLTICVLYNLWVLIVRQSFPELQEKATTFWLVCDGISDCVFVFDVVVQLRTGYLEQGLMVSIF